VKNRGHEGAAGTKDARCGESDYHNCPPQSESYVDKDRTATPTTQAHASGETLQIVRHQYEVRRRQGNVRPVRAHCDPDRARFERESVIDAVADDHRAMTVLHFAEDEFHFLRRESFGVDFRETDLSRYPVGLALGIPSDHELAPQSQIVELSDGVFRFRPHLVGE
jgi:hypothetical protein